MSRYGSILKIELTLRLTLRLPAEQLGGDWRYILLSGEKLQDGCHSQVKNV